MSAPNDIAAPNQANDPGRRANDPLDAAGQNILGLLHEAAGLAEQNCRTAIASAQDLSAKLKAAQARIGDLEANLRYYQNRSGRAEGWLTVISSEIEQRFFRQSPP